MLFSLTHACVLVVGVLVIDSRALSRARFILVRLLAVRLFMYFLTVNFSPLDGNEYFSSTFVFSDTRKAKKFIHLSISKVKSLPLGRSLEAHL